MGLSHPLTKSILERGTMKPLHGRRKRIARLMLIDYKALMKRPVRGFVRLGGGLDFRMAILDAEKEGFHVTPVEGGLELR